MFGTFGYELDVTQLSDAEKSQIPAQIARWHGISSLVRDGELYRLGNPFRPSGYAAQQNADYDAWIFVSADKSEAVFTYIQITAEANMKSRRILLAGLDADADYAFTRCGSEDVKSGAYLMQCGMMLPNLGGDMQSVQIILQKV